MDQISYTGLDHWLYNYGYFRLNDINRKRWKKIKKQHNLIIPKIKTIGQNKKIFIILGFELDPTNISTDQIFWTKNKIKEIRRISDREIIIKPHPQTLTLSENPYFANKNNKTFYNMNLGFKKELEILDGFMDSFVLWDKINLSDLIDDIHIGVLHSSTSCFELIYNGVPVHTEISNFGHDLSVPLEKIEAPYIEERYSWFEKMAFTEWSRKEIAGGYPWKRLRKEIKDRIKYGN